MTWFWLPYANGLPDGADVRDLEVHPATGVMRAAPFGRSAFEVNTDDPQQMLTNILIAAANANDPKLRDPRLLQTILQEIQLRKMFSFFGLSAQDFVSILQANAIRLRPEIDPAQRGNANNLFGSTSDTFRISATGRVGRIEKQLTAVVRYDDGMGKMLYWKED